MGKVLTPKQIEWAYTKWCEGYTQQQIADALFVCKKTVVRAIGIRPRIRPILEYSEDTDDRLTPKAVTHEASDKYRCTCPNCKKIVDTFKETANGRSEIRAINNYCPYCGQALEMQGDEE